jgi:hypothetical protein
MQNEFPVTHNGKEHDNALIGRPFQYEGKEYYAIGCAKYDTNSGIWFGYYDGVFDPDTRENVSTDGKEKFLKEVPYYESMRLKATDAFRKGVEDFAKSVTVKKETP